jgi:NAD(P)-dependent dehydrogenase (short-subunit alcohol dehydrogenase family)
MLSRRLYETEGIRPLVVMQAAEAELLKNKGVIINVSSVSAVSESPVPGLVPYYVAKSAQVGVHAACRAQIMHAAAAAGMAAAARMATAGRGATLLY